MIEELVEVLLVQLNLCAQVRGSRSIGLVARGQALFPKDDRTKCSLFLANLLVA